jgi:hypothetical protein
MTTRNELIEAVKIATTALNLAEVALADFDGLAENNVYSTLAEALDKVEDRLRGMASSDCEGAHNCGADLYTQDFIVGGVVYTGSLQVEYNRHDKTYYYIDSSDFTYEQKAAS